MPKALTPELRAQREAGRRAEEALRVRAAWQDKLAKASEQKDAAYSQFAQTGMRVRELWLLLAVFELEERNSDAGYVESTMSAWLDRIAPRARDGYTGVSGFTARIGGAIPAYVRLSKNGYVYCNGLGYSLVLALREKYPVLASPEDWNYFKPIPLTEDFVVPAPRWRAWESRKMAA